MAVEKKSLISKSTPSTKNVKTTPVAAPKLQTAVALAKKAHFAKKINIALAKKAHFAKYIG